MAIKKIRALIIGAGNIAAGYDNPDSQEILTHAHGYLSVPEFELAGFVDADAAKARQAAKKWGCKAFDNVKAAFSSGDIDVVSVATPDATHAEVLKKLAEFAPRLIFAEKPLALTLADAGEIMALYCDSATEVQVNYLRRFVPEFREIRAAISKGSYGRFLTGSGCYVKGFLHNGSHMVDLLCFLLGDASRMDQVAIYGGMGEDPEISARIVFGGGSFAIQSVAGNPYWIFEMDLFFEKKRLRILNSGTVIQQFDPFDSHAFPGTVELHETAPQPTELGRAMHFAMQNIRDHLLRNEPLLCPLADALETLKTCLVRP